VLRNRAKAKVEQKTAQEEALITEKEQKRAEREIKRDN
jgi:hypothetical protein